MEVQSMSENQTLEMHNEEGGLGNVEIAPEVIEVIASIAASEVDGISQMRGNFATGVAEKLGKKNHGKGVKVDIRENSIVIDVYCHVKFGTSIPKVAQEAQENIRQTLLNMTALEASEVNIHIVGVQFENTKPDIEAETEL